MKVILSRKGFDSQNGKTPSTIMPNGDLISMPIPSGDKDRYQDLIYQGHDYLDILSDLKPSMKYGHCHVDPDLSPKTRKNRPGHWTPAFGQINQSQIYLSETVRVEPGDLFLFFGSFHRVKEENGHYRYVRHSGDFYQDNAIHAIFGYLQFGKIVTDPEEAKKLFWHPHACEDRIHNPTNAIYLPAERLSFRPDLPGCGLFKYDERRVLTLEGHPKATWKTNGVYMPDSVIGKRKNSSKGPGVFYCGIWQELALKETPEAERWAVSLF